MISPYFTNHETAFLLIIGPTLSRAPVLEKGNDQFESVVKVSFLPISSVNLSKCEGRNSVRLSYKILF